MEQGLPVKNRNYLIAGLVVLAAIILIATVQKTPKDLQKQTQQEQAEGQTNGENSKGNSQENQNQASLNENEATSPSSSNLAGNVSASGRLRPSDNLSKGNLMLDSNRGRIYVSTKRDFSALLDKQIILAASGTIDSFVFLGFKQAGAASDSIAGIDTTAMGGAGEESASTLNLSGRLEKSDNEAKGNYMIISAVGKVYLLSQRDYTAWVASGVDLTALGTIYSFTGAILNKK